MKKTPMTAKSNFAFGNLLVSAFMVAATIAMTAILLRATRMWFPIGFGLVGYLLLTVGTFLAVVRKMRRPDCDQNPTMSLNDLTRNVMRIQLFFMLAALGGIVVISH